MPHAICKNCGRDVCYPVGDEPRCPCQSKDFILLEQTKIMQAKDLAYLRSTEMGSKLIRTIEKIDEQYTVFQSYKELFWIYDHLKKIRPGVIVEIGCYNGGTLEVWRQFARLGGREPKKIIGIDIDTQRIKIASEAKDKVTLLQFDSTDPALASKLDLTLAGDKIDFAFIDGQHIYSYVKNDFDLLWPRVRKGGAVAFHDISWSDGDVGRFWGELKGDKHETREAFGIGIIYKEVDNAAMDLSKMQD